LVRSFIVVNHYYEHCHSRYKNKKEEAKSFDLRKAFGLYFRLIMSHCFEIIRIKLTFLRIPEAQREGAEKGLELRISEYYLELIRDRNILDIYCLLQDNRYPLSYSSRGREQNDLMSDNSVINNDVVGLLKAFISSFLTDNRREYRIPHACVEYGSDIESSAIYPRTKFEEIDSLFYSVVKY
jgi:hypothetical protein